MKYSRGRTPVQPWLPSQDIRKMKPIIVPDHRVANESYLSLPEELAVGSQWLLREAESVFSRDELPNRLSIHKQSVRNKYAYDPH